MSIVYQVVNEINGYRYIGVTNNLSKRWRYHLGSASRGSNLKFHSAIRKYGAEHFVRTVLVEIDDEDLAYVYEEELIAKNAPEYNMAAGGRGGWHTGATHSPETKARLSAIAKGRPGYWAGKKRSPETIEKMRAGALANPQRYWLGKTRDPEMMAHIAEQNRGRKLPPSQKRVDGAYRGWAKRRGIVT